MLTLAVDLHQSQITYVVLDQHGAAVEKGSVSTKPPSVDRLIARLVAASGGKLIVGFEECGFGHWLHRLASSTGCRVVRIQPLKKQPHKTDKRDATMIGEILTVNRDRILDGRPLIGARRVDAPSEDHRQARVKCNERRNLAKMRHTVICNIKDIVRRLNLQHGRPTKGWFTRAARQWLEAMDLPKADRATLTRLLCHYDFLEQQIADVQADIEEQAGADAACGLLQTIPGAADLTSLGLMSRIGSIKRFKRPGSLANFFGLTPSLNDSGETIGRVGSITKRGNSYARFLLGQLVLHVTAKDAALRQWRRKIKKRRGAKIALVATMRRLTTIIWHMLRTGETYASVRARLQT